MNGKDLFEGLNHIDERYIEEAETRAFPRPHWLRTAALAACLCLALLGLYTLRGPTGAESSAQDESTLSAGGAEPGEAARPENKPVIEVPSVLLFIREQTDHGYTAIVAELVDTDIFELGMEVNVALTDTVRLEDADGHCVVADQMKQDYTGTYVLVQFTRYDRETGTLVVNQIREVPPPETTP